MADETGTELTWQHFFEHEFIVYGALKIEKMWLHLIGQLFGGLARAF